MICPTHGATKWHPDQCKHCKEAFAANPDLERLAPSARLRYGGKKSKVIVVEVQRELPGLREAVSAEPPKQTSRRWAKRQLSADAQTRTGA